MTVGQRSFDLSDASPFASLRKFLAYGGGVNTSPDAIGLMRCNPNGKRQLHEWADGLYGELAADLDTDIPCDCAL